MNYAKLVTLGFGLVSGFSLFCSPAWAVTYECVDATGTVIFTDSPSQLTRCVTATKGTLATVGQSAPAAAGAGTQPSVSPAPVQPEPAASSLSPAGIAVPVTRAGRSLVVQARLNDLRDAKLIVDTGADITVLSRAVAMDIGLLPSLVIATVTLNTAGGSVRADVFRVGTVSLGTAEARNVTAAVHDLPDAPAGVDGLLGLTFLDQFLVTLDAKKGELHLKPRQ
jgi:clan AA aspartic protease (TIGR02281 family)